ncbi:MAG: ATP-binding protein [Gammaproteobacteria bacterium]|nr:ATP-binding protein [Pseudomonadales bacterium]MCP5349326.1 ATP-binding protein [Pseudomonadales bacterium]
MAATKLLNFTFPASPEHLCTVRTKLRDTLGSARFPQETIDCIVLAIGEACMNIIQHAYCDGDCGDIVLEIVRQDSCLVFRLTDFARHKSRQEEMQSRPLDEIRPGGLGCHIINEIMDEVELLDCGNRQGNILQMKKELTS